MECWEPSQHSLIDRHRESKKNTCRGGRSYYFLSPTQLPRRPVIRPPFQTHIQSVNSLSHSATPSVRTSVCYFQRFSFSHCVDKARYTLSIRNEPFTFPQVTQRCNTLRNYASCRSADFNLLITFSSQHPTSFMTAYDLEAQR